MAEEQGAGTGGPPPTEFGNADAATLVQQYVQGIKPFKPNPYHAGRPTDRGLRANEQLVGSFRYQRYTPPLTHEESAQQLANYDKLTPFEQRIFNWLPGFSETTVGKALHTFGESWAGKALSVLDVGAEALERGTGFVTQWANAIGNPEEMENFRNNLGAAWYASGLSSDFGNVPSIQLDEDGLRLEYPTDLPGVQGLVEARHKITDLMNQGMSSGDALVQVREEMYDSLGALALRSQIQDTVFHLAADPLNLILPRLKPVERLHTIRAAALTEKVAPESISFLENARRMALAEGRLDDAARIAENLETAQQNLVNPLERMVISITGGSDLNPTKAQGGRLAMFNPFRLRPEARAQELLTQVHNALNTNVIRVGDEPLEIYEKLVRISNGSIGPEFGHLFLTEEGRVLQSFLKGSEIEAQKLLGAWNQSQDSIKILEGVADELGLTPQQVLRQVLDDDPAILNQLGQGIADKIKVLDGLPITKQEFALAVSTKVTDWATQSAILRYGVQSRGLVLKAAAALKAGETLAFLRINPGFVMRNFLNNEITMIARGVGGVTLENMDDIWKSFGLAAPKRLEQAFTMAGETLIGGKPLGSSEQLIADMLRGKPGRLDRFADWANRVKFPGDLGPLASRVEANASKRAFTSGFLQHYKQFWQPGKGFDLVESVLHPRSVDAMRAFNAEMPEKIQQLVSSARSPEDIAAIRSVLNEGNLNVSFQAISDNASARFGANVDDVLGTETVARLQDELAKVSDEAGAVRVFEDERVRISQLLDEEMAERLGLKADEVAARVQAQGPQGVVDTFNDTVDYFDQFHVSHAFRQSKIADDLRLLEPGTASKFWRTRFAQDQEAFTHLQNLVKGNIQAFQEGAAQAGFKIPPAINDEVNGWFRSWRSFFDRRNKLWTEFAEARAAGKTPKMAAEDIQALLNTEYHKAVQVEQNALALMDEMVARSFEQANPEMATSFRAFRKSLRDQRLEIKLQVAAIRDEVAQLASSKERNARWYSFWQEYAQRTENIWRTQRQGLNMQQGDRAAQAQFDNLALREARAAAQAEPVELPQVDDVISLPRRDLDPDLSQAVEIEARDMLDELKTAQGPVVIPGEEGGIRASDNPGWYVDMYQEGFQNKQTVINALQRIVDDGGRDAPDFKYLTRVKEAVRDRLLAQEAAGMSPDVIARLKGQPTEAELLRINQVFESVDDLPIDQPFLTDPQTLADFGQPWAETMLQHWHTRGFDALGEMERAAIDQFRRPALNLPDEFADDLERYLRVVEGQMKDARYAAIRMGEFRRDAALLNYNRRYNYNTWLGTVLPFEFWMTQSMIKWAIHSLDRPAMLSSFYRIKQFLNTAGAPQSGFPSRLRGHIRVPMPFLPKWMGDAVYFDPMRMLFPFDQMTYAWEQWGQMNHKREGRAERVLNDWLSEGQISDEDFQQAVNGQNTPLWDLAMANVEQNDADLKYDAWDFMSTFSSPHAPLVWAAEIAQGTPEDIGPFLPLTRGSKGIAGLFGLDPWFAPHNIEGTIRKHLGLPAYDKWDDYRVDRMLANMVSRGEITIDDALRAMIDREGDVYQMAISKANREYGIQGTFGFLGIPAKAYPEGERLQRQLQDDFSTAYEQYEAGDVGALTDFFERFPEYEARLALWDEPEERLRGFLTDHIWDAWHDLPDLHKTEVREQLGDLFESRFLSKDTRNYKDIDVETLQMWLTMLGGDPPGSLASSAPALDLSDPDMAFRLQIFYDARENYFNWPEIREWQNQYFQLAEGAERKKFRQAHPMLENYWNWRRDFMTRNPELAPYMTDNPESIPGSTVELVQSQPNFTWQEWQMVLPFPLQNQLLQGPPLSPAAQDLIDEIALSLGVSASEVLDDVVAAMSEAQVAP